MELKEYFLNNLLNEITILSNNNKSMYNSISYKGNFQEINDRHKINLISENEFRLEKIEYIINQLKKN